MDNQLHPDRELTKDELLWRFIIKTIPLLDIMNEYIPQPLCTNKNQNATACLFCNDSGQHLTVNPDKNIFYCYECHISGGVIEFICRVKDLSFNDSVKYLVNILLDGKKYEKHDKEILMKRYEEAKIKKEKKDDNK